MDSAIFRFVMFSDGRCGLSEGEIPHTVLLSCFSVQMGMNERANRVFLRS
jgi:hypothetical protein